MEGCSARFPALRAAVRRGHAAQAAAAAAGVNVLTADAKEAVKLPQTEELASVLPPGYDEVPKPPQKGRRAGVLLHPTSLPGPHGSGDLGKDAFQFVDWLKSAGATVWQVLPLVPPERIGWSPYSGTDANSGNTLMISLEKLVEDGLLDASDLPSAIPVKDCDFNNIAAFKEPLLFKAAAKLLTLGEESQLFREYKAFISDPKISAWLPEAALFSSIENKWFPGKDWWTWPEELKFRQPAAIENAKNELEAEIEQYIGLQFLFQHQWMALKNYANSNGISIVGDMPIYVGGHCADVWGNPHLWTLDKDMAPEFVSGVPPDLFSETGQLWGSPLYNWPEHSKEGYKWWSRRLGRAMELYDELRIDHFRGLAAYYSVKATEETAMHGQWLVGPRTEFFECIAREIGEVNIIAEDLGIITDDVVALRLAINAPGMEVLLFGFDGDANNIHLPHNYYENSFAYPGTHDNDTVLGWFKEKATPEARQQIKDYMNTNANDVSFDFIRAVASSVAKTVVAQMQDVMSLDNSARMNTPGRQAGNWAWRIPKQLKDLKFEAERFRKVCELYDRLPVEEQE
eukprot:jgi/Chlat1/6436/Chrsp45S09064